MSNCTVYLNDCLKTMDEMIADGLKTKFVFTSPPYNRIRNDKYSNYSDTKKNYFEFLCEVTDKALKIGEYVFLNLQKNYYNKKDVFKFIGKYADKIIDTVCWTKKNPMPANGLNLTNSYEFIFILSATAKTIKTNKTYVKNHIDTPVYSANPYKKIHRAVMNPDVVQWFIDTFTTKGDTILDCFMGVGTTGVSCLSNERNFIGVEIDETYFDIARARMDELLTANVTLEKVI